jgi:hypothetical protein
MTPRVGARATSGGPVRVTVRTVVAGVGLSLLALLAACGSGSPGSASPAPPLPKAEATRLQITAYGKALRPVVKADEALWRKISRVQALVGSNTNAFSMAARIDDSYLPALVQIQTRLAAIKAPPGFRTVQARLEQVCSVQNDFLFFLQDSLRRALYTHTAQPGFPAAAQRYIARWKKAVREYDLAVRAAIKRSGVKVKPRLLTGTLV